MPRGVSAVLLTAWFQMEHKSTSLSVSTLTLHALCASGLINTHGIACLICCPWSGQKRPSAVPHFIPSQAIEKHCDFFLTSAWLTLLSLINVHEDKDQKPKKKKKITNPSPLDSPNTLWFPFMSSRSPVTLRCPNSPRAVHWAVMPS